MWTNTWRVAVLCSFVGGCFTVSSDGESDGPSVRIESLSTSTTTLDDAASFDISWDVSHTEAAGYVTDVGLYVGTSADLETASERDRRALFKLATTHGVPDRTSKGSMTCTRNAAQLSCGGGRHELAAGEQELTFRACNSYVLDTAEVCETRAIVLALP
jgi:hypothetical protein